MHVYALRFHTPKHQGHRCMKGLLDHSMKSIKLAQQRPFLSYMTNRPDVVNYSMNTFTDTSTISGCVRGCVCVRNREFVWQGCVQKRSVPVQRVLERASLYTQRD